MLVMFLRHTAQPESKQRQQPSPPTNNAAEVASPYPTLVKGY